MAQACRLLLHQATEALDHRCLLTETPDSPKLHDLRKPRPIAEGMDMRLVAAWPRDTGFARLRVAYVNARHAPHHAIAAQALAWLTERIEIRAGRLGDPSGGAGTG